MVSVGARSSRSSCRLVYACGSCCWCVCRHSGARRQTTSSPTRRCLVRSNSVGTCGASCRANRTMPSASSVCARRMAVGGCAPHPPLEALILGGSGGGPSARGQKSALRTPLRCKAQGGWGGSAHWPDPTAQSVRPEYAERRLPARARPPPSRPNHPGSRRPRGASDTATPYTHATHATLRFTPRGASDYASQGVRL